MKKETSSRTTRKKVTPHYKFKRQYNPLYKGEPSKIKWETSKTVPDLNLSVRELMTRHTRGVGIDSQTREEIYLDEQGLEVPRIEDLTDLDNMREQLADKEKELSKQLKAEKAERAEKLKQQIKQEIQQEAETKAAEAAAKTE